MRISPVRIATLVGVAALGAACSHKAPEPAGAAPSASASVAAAPAPSGSSAAPAPSGSADTSAAAFSTGFDKANVNFVLNPYNLPAYSGPTGSVEGVVTIDGPPAPNVQLAGAGKCPAAIDVYGKAFRDGTPAKPNGPRPLADAVVAVTGFEKLPGYTGFYVPEKNDAVRLSINASCGYPTRTLAITYGQHLEIGNETKLLFAPVIDDVSTPAVMVVPPAGNGEPVKIYPRQAGYFQMTDQMEPFVREDLYVFRHPLHAVTDRAGHFRIDGVPAGSLLLSVYHPGAKATGATQVQFLEGVVQKADVALTYKPVAAPPPVDLTKVPPWRRPND
jgi:hypothetical protein